MLSGLRQNDTPDFHLAYLEFEVKYFEKVMMRREVLNSKDKVKFVDGEADVPMGSEVPEGETKPGDEANFVKIVWANIQAKYGQDVITLRKAKNLLKASKYLLKAEP